MSEKFDMLYDALKREHVISLYHNRVMFYDEGYGEIQFWVLSEKEDKLTISNKGVSISFDGWSLNLNDDGKATGISLKLGETVVATMKFPSKAKIIQNHNHFYIEEFATEMSCALDKSTEQKGDWADCAWDTLQTGLKSNLGKLKKKTEKEELRKSCVDLANYAAMMYYIFGGEGN